MATQTGKAARIAVTSAAATASTGEAATLSTDGLTLQINSTGKRHWDTDPTVYEGGVPLVNDWTVNRVVGNIVFSTAHSTGSTWTFDVEHYTSSFVGEGRSWTVTASADIRDHTTFSTSTGGSSWRTVKPGLSGATVSIDRFWVPSTGAAFFDRLAAGTATVVELWSDAATRNKLEGFAYVAGDGFTVPVDGDATESIELTINGQLHNSTI